MSQFVIAAAQSISIAGDLAANRERHARFIAEAARHGVQLLVFPELSLTGYELELAADLAMPPAHALFADMQQLARAVGMIVIAGAPLLDENAGRHIGAVVLGGAEGPEFYAKQHLFGAEQERFIAGRAGKICTIGQTRVALAICADVTHPEHAAAAARAEVQVYAAGVMVTARGYASEAALLQGYSKQHRMAVLMANHGGPSGGWDAIGRSAFWAGGELIADASGDGECIVVAQREGERWSGRTVQIGDDGV